MRLAYRLFQGAAVIGSLLALTFLSFGQNPGSVCWERADNCVCPGYSCTDFPGDTWPDGPVPSTSVSIGNPTGIAVDSSGNVYIAGPSIVFKLDRSGMITRIAGNGHNGFSGDGGPATDALLDFPRARPYDPFDFWDVVGSIAVDSSGSVYITDFFNNRLRKVTPDGIISTAAGPGAAGPGVWPGGVAVDPIGKLYVTAFSPKTWYTFWRVASDGSLMPFASNNCGLGNEGNESSSPPDLCLPYGLAADASGKLYAADTGGRRILQITPEGTASIIAGSTMCRCSYSGDGGPATSAAISEPYSAAVDSVGNVYIADTGNNRIRRISPDGIITTVAGGGWPPWAGGYSGDGGPATSAQLNHPHAVTVDADGNLYIADTDNFVVRKVAPDGIITTVAGNGFWCCGDSQAGR